MVDHTDGACGIQHDEKTLRAHAWASTAVGDVKMVAQMAYEAGWDAHARRAIEATPENLRQALSDLYNAEEGSRERDAAYDVISAALSRIAVLEDLRPLSGAATPGTWRPMTNAAGVPNGVDMQRTPATFAIVHTDQVPSRQGADTTFIAAAVNAIRAFLGQP